MDPDDGDVLGLDAFAGFFERSALPTMAVAHERRAIIQVNRAALALLGLEAHQVLGRPGTDFLIEPSPDQLRRIRALRGDETAAVREVPSALGVRTVELNIVPSGVDGVAFIELTDLTDVLEAAERADVTADELTRASDALTTVAARLAHDLRGPLAAISGFSDLLLHDPDSLDETQRARLLERIGSSTHALSAMTASILSEADTGAPRPGDTSFDVADLFRAVRGVTEAQLAQSAGTLETAAEVATLPVPVGRIRQAVINLVSNSIKFRDPARPLTIEVAVRSGEAGTHIAVRDNGRGLPEDPASLFEAGARGPAAEGTPGAGLGLAFVRAAAEAVGGRVSARPLPAGAEFVIVLPAQDEGSDDLEQATGDRVSSMLTAPQLERIIEATPVATFVIDIALRQIVRVNRASLELLGFEEEEILGRPGSDFLDERAIAESLQRRLMDDPAMRHGARTRLRTATGEVAATVWVAAVEGTALAVAQAIEDDAREP